jgi:hypothetical protein
MSAAVCAIAHREQHALQAIGQDLGLQAAAKQAEDAILGQHFLCMHASTCPAALLPQMQYAARSRNNAVIVRPAH